MIDYYNNIYDTVANAVRTKHPNTSTSGEYISSPSQFPCMTCEEIGNVDIQKLFDSSRAEKFARVTYRIQVCSNSTNGKKAEAREIFSTADAAIKGLGFGRKTYATTPDLYQSTMYSITATYEAVIDSTGVVYGRE